MNTCFFFFLKFSFSKSESLHNSSLTDLFEEFYLTLDNDILIISSH